MLLVTGILQRVQERPAGNPGNQWTEQTLVVADFGVTHYATVARDFGPLPSVGDPVALNVGVRGYVKKDQAAGVGFTAFGRNVEAEAALFGLTASSSAA